MSKHPHKRLSELSKRQKLRRSLNVIVNSRKQAFQKQSNIVQISESHTSVQVQTSSPTEIFPNNESDKICHELHKQSDTENLDEYQLQQNDISPSEKIENVSNFSSLPDLELSDSLKNWCLRHKITNTATTDLLKILQTHRCFSHFPKDARTLLQTPKQTITKPVPPGEYCSFDIRNGLEKIVQEQRPGSTISLQINIDGLPLFKSSPVHFWPILISAVHSNTVFPVGIFVGKEKPDNVNEYLEDFVHELNYLITNGFSTNDITYPVKIHSFICDAPARAFICGIKNHTGYYACGKCSVKGKYIENRVVLTKLSSPLRTDQTFRGREQTGHHNGDSILEELPIDMVESFPFEYMHLVCLGVVRKLIHLWMRGKPGPFKLHKKQIDTLSESHVALSKDFPKEFNRKPRSLWEIDRWKATELRTFLLYTGPVVLKNVIKSEQYNLFICLSVAIRILAKPNESDQRISYAEELLIYFVEGFKQIFGRVNCSYNVHGLIHLANDVRKLGCLDVFSAFKFENYLGQLKRLIRSSKQPLQQIHRRIIELQNCEDTSRILPNKTTLSTPCTLQYLGNSHVIYQKIVFKNFTFLPSDLVVLLSGEIFKVRGGCAQDTLGIFGCLMEKCDTYFETPCKSEFVGITVVKRIEGEFKKIELTSVLTKCLSFVISDEEIVVFPLL